MCVCVCVCVCVLLHSSGRLTVRLISRVRSPDGSPAGCDVMTLTSPIPPPGGATRLAGPSPGGGLPRGRIRAD